MTRAFLIFMCLGTAAWSDEGWIALTGDAAQTALANHRVVYANGATQTFAPSGDTQYDSGHLQPGRWRIEGDRYCSQWPPSDAWGCYGLEVSSDGTRLRFTAADGSSTEGTLVPGL